MNAVDAVSLTTLVVGERVVRVRVDAAGGPRSSVVTVTTDDGREWLFEEPGWRNLCYGVVDRQFYWWSARHLVAIPLRPGDDLVEVWTDEDILFVFAAPGGEWLMVCETSVRLLDGDRELSRVELAEAIADVRWNRPYLLVNDVSGISIRVTLVEGGLVA